MPPVRQIDRQALTPYSVTQMFALVDDIERYPQFLPWCKGAKIITRSATEVVAALHIHKGALNAHFTTRNRMEPPAAIHLELVEGGPFKTLTGEWRFTDIGGGRGSRVEFSMRFAFANPLNAWLLEPVFEHTASALLDAFLRRARDVYGASANANV